MNSNNSVPPSVSAVAATAKGKLQELVRSIEAYSKNRDPEGSALEQAWRTMFASCTIGAGPIPASRASPESQPLPPSPVSAFSSRKSRKGSSKKPMTDSSEHIYAQLFYDDQIRAAKEVATTPVVPKPFPMSSPARNKAPLATPEVSVPAASFDDGISAISAHTLEAMDKTQQKATLRNRSGSSTLFPTEEEEEEPVREHPLKYSSPFSHARSRSSQGSRYSKRSYSSKSHSTPTTQSSRSSFEHIFEANEANYWKNEVRTDEKRKTRRTLDTMSTAASSFDSRRHPHDVMPYLASDPDRIHRAMDIPLDAEMAEI